MEALVGLQDNTMYLLVPILFTIGLVLISIIKKSILKRNNCAANIKPVGPAPQMIIGYDDCIELIYVLPVNKKANTAFAACMIS